MERARRLRCPDITGIRVGREEGVPLRWVADRRVHLGREHGVLGLELAEDIVGGTSVGDGSRR